MLLQIGLLRIANILVKEIQKDEYWSLILSTALAVT